MSKSTKIKETSFATIYVIGAIWLVAIYICLIYYTGWISDDARITFIAVDNAYLGAGPVFNIGERVQVFTHTLWYLLLFAGTFLWHNTIQFAYGLSSLLSIVSFASLFFCARYRSPVTLLFTSLLILSIGFVDYSTSGLENPLGYALFMTFVVSVVARPGVSGKIFFLATLLFSLLYLTRPDYILMLAPVMLYLWWQLPNWRQRIVLPLLGGIPILLWTAFAVFYYGTPFPNTAYAKLGINIASGEIFIQGLRYFQATLVHDAVSLLVIFSGIVLCLLKGKTKQRLCALGVLLYMIYLLRIGGDFMLSRHFAVPAFFVVALLTTIKFDGLRSRPVAIVICALMIAAPFAAARQHLVESSRIGKGFYHGISDERIYWQRSESLRKEIASGVKKGFRGKISPTSASMEYSSVKTACGWLGTLKALDRATFFVDTCALTEPLLARLPVLDTQEWRIGHFARPLPYGYLESISEGGEVYDHLLESYLIDDRKIRRGALWKSDRLLAIMRNNLSKDQLSEIRDDYLLDVDLLEQSRQAKIVVLPSKKEKAIDVEFSGLISFDASKLPTADTSMNLVFSTPGPYRVVLEYVDPMWYPLEEFSHWEQVDYILAVLRPQVGRNELSVTLPFLQKDNREKLMYIHILSGRAKSENVKIDFK